MEDFPLDAEEHKATPINDLNTINEHNPLSFCPPPLPKRVKCVPPLEDIPKWNHHWHAKRRDRCNTAIHANGQTPRPATLRNLVSKEHVFPSALDMSTLPSTHGAYTTQVEDRQSKYSAKKRHSLTELITLGFWLVKWDGVCVSQSFYPPAHSLQLQ